MPRVEPKVYCVAKTNLDSDSLSQYLQDIGDPDWKPTTDVGGELLIEAAGRMCYRSWQPYDPEKPYCSQPNVSKVREDSKVYFENVLKSGHGSILEHVNMSFICRNVSRVFCYHPDTEILTQEGFKNITEIKGDETLLTLDPETGISRWSKNHKLHEFPFDGDLHYFSSSQWDSPLMTPDHLQWCSRYDKRRFRGRRCNEIIESAEKIPLSEVKGKRIVVKHNIDLSANNPDVIGIGDYTYEPKDLFFWLGMVASDGSISEDRNNVSIIQRKASNLKKIRKIMNSLFGDRWKDYGHEFRITDCDLKQWVIGKIGRKSDERRLYNLFNYDKKLLKCFYRGFLLGDGNVHQNGHEVLYCSYEDFVKDLQVIVALIGFSSNIRENDRIGVVNAQYNIEHKIKNRILSVHRKGCSLVKKGHHKSQRYVGNVYCPETDDGLVYVRNKGMAFWSGNTHELVRHRAGCAYSQESLRYVRLNILDYWLPSDVLENEEGAKKFDEVMEKLGDIQGQLAEIYDIDNIKAFSVKKQLTSAFRRIAPIGLATSILFTANIRALRHMIKMRTDVAAEEEIRIVFDEVAQICKDTYPMLFQDMEKQEDGSWKFLYNKV